MPLSAMTDRCHREIAVQPADRAAFAPFGEVPWTASWFTGRVS